MACRDEQIRVADAEPLALGMAQWRERQGTATETTAVFRDSAFENDVAKSNLAAILEQHGVKHVRSLGGHPDETSFRVRPALPGRRH